ncbi:MAG: T9SS type A sorting domain-containing protein [Saprospiraceae bacterium]|nr:T9SS type A sorting domain-containing protein [Saprospiraceae bacterium]
MRTLFLIIALIINSVLNSFSQSYILNVNNAFGGGSYNEGDTIYVWANPDFNDYAFSGWSGSATNYMLEPNEWITRIVVPSGSSISTLNASAQFTNIAPTTIFSTENISLPALSGTTTTTTSKSVHFRVPQNPKGIIFCFHGTNGSGLGFTNDIEKSSFFKSGVLRDYIMVATDANEKTMGDQNGDNKKRWQIYNGTIDNLSNNIDLQVIQALKDTIFDRMSLPSSFPCFALGCSNGANFADLCAAALNFNASGHITGNGIPNVYTRPDSKPVIFIQSENDQHDNAIPSVPVNNHNTLLSRNIASELHWHKKTPMYKFRFVRNADMLVTPSISDSIFQRMQNTPGLLDAKNIIQVAEISQLPPNLFDNLGLTNAIITDCENQIKIVNADHKFHSHYSNRILDFFDAHLNITTNIYDAEIIDEPILFPNPVTNFLYIKNISLNAQVQIFSLNGKLIATYNNPSEINVSDFNNGAYVLVIQNEQNQFVKKFIKTD